MSDFSHILSDILTIALEGLNCVDDLNEVKTLATIVTRLQDEGIHPSARKPPPEPIPAENPPGGIPFMCIDQPGNTEDDLEETDTDEEYRRWRGDYMDYGFGGE